MKVFKNNISKENFMKFSNREDIEKSLNNTILSASGWRKIFAKSNNEEDKTDEIGITNSILSILMAETFSDYVISKTKKQSPIVAIGIDARPTGPAIADCMIKVLLTKGIQIQFLGIAAAPEIMAYAKQIDGFIYISASHNPVGHNGVKFGLNDGGVLPGAESNPLAEIFKSKCKETNLQDKIKSLILNVSDSEIEKVYNDSQSYKSKALLSYEKFVKEIITGENDEKKQNELLSEIKANNSKKSIGIVCDMNGSARTCSIDKTFFNSLGFKFHSINDEPRQIVHAIIPEPENLVYCAKEMEKLQSNGNKEAILGFMPDCDGDRGNIVFWNSRTNKSEILKAQEVFALSVMAETSFLNYMGYNSTNSKIAVAVNDPTSLRIEEIMNAFNASVFRAEVGEANVVNLAREKRNEGYMVRILGEGSNGGNITHPGAVRDPVSTLFSIIKLLILRDTAQKNGLFHIWCKASHQEDKYKDDFTLADVLETLPVYTTTGVSEPRAVAKITQKDHSKLKKCFQTVFEDEWKNKKEELKKLYDFYSYEAISNNGTKEFRNINDYSVSGKGGLKVLFKNSESKPIAFIWMRGSGTEPVFRVMCDIKGSKTSEEQKLLQWLTEMILKANEMSLA